MYKYFQNKRAIQNNQRSDNRFFHKYVCDFLGFFFGSTLETTETEIIYNDKAMYNISLYHTVA